MAAPLRIVFLGTFQLSAGTTVVTTVNTPRLQALLAYLVLRRGVPQSRPQLAFLLWPDSTDAQARTNLRTLLHRLRAALPDADALLTIDATGVCWRADAPFTLDVVEFETALAHASSAEQAGATDTARAALEHAAALYQGDLLPDCYDEWVLPERERLQRQALDALEQLVEHLERHRDYAAAIDYARRLLRLDSLREATYLSLMGLYAARGDRADALRVYHTCATILDRELGVEPSTATRAAYTRLVSGDALSTRPVVSAPVDLPIGTVTFLFTDIQGSTRLWEQHARQMSATLARHDAILREAIETHAGVVFRTAGDAICAAFARATDALTAALAAQRTLQSERWGVTGPLRVRMALHTGVVETRDGDYVGHPLNRLARILATGHGGQMLLSQATQELVCDCLPPEVALRDLGTHRLKDLTRPEQIFQLVVADLPGSFPPLKSLGAQPRTLPIPAPMPPPTLVALAPLIGRAAEWARAQAIWQAAASGRARLLVLAGEAGIGKTRLAEELVTWAGHQGAATAIARCYATEGDLAYAPVTEWLRADALRRRLARLEPIWLTEVARLVPDVLTERPDLPRPGPLTEHWQRRRLFEALARAILAGDRPLLLLIDDLQWCDRDALEWLHFLLRYETRARLLVVGTVRAEEAGADLAALLDDVRRSDQLTEIALGPLGQADAAALAGHMAGQPLSASVAADLYAETEGNPLFVVESVRAGLVHEVQGHGDADKIPAPIRLPPGVQAVISHRLNQITPAARELLCLAAVIGRSFTFSVLARAAESDEDTLVRGLDELWQRRIVREQGADAYDFSHDKLRAVVYAGLSTARRRVLHRHVAEALEAEHAADLDAVSGQIASHYEPAGIADRSVDYYQRAAEVAQRVYANAEAIGHLTKGLEVLATLPASPERLQHELDLQTALGHALMVVKGYAAPEVQQVYGRARELCRHVEQTPQLFQVLWGLAYFYTLRSQCRTAREVGEQLFSLAQRTQDPILLQQAHNALAGALLHLGELSAAQAHLQQGLALYDPQQHRALVLRLGMDLRVFFLAYMVRPLWLLGYPDQALQQSQKALTMAQELAHPFSLTYALTFAALGHQFRREVQATQIRAEALCALAREKGIAFFLAFGTGLRGWALAEQGQSDTGMLQMREGMAACRTTGAEADRPYFLTLVAGAYRQEGRYGEGLAMLEEALALVNQSEERYWEAEIHRLNGELLLARSAENQVEAEACLHKALDVAHRQGAKSLELRAAMSLGRLWQHQGKRVAAHDLLAPIYGWFTEGFDTADLQEAKVLLAALT